MLAHQREYRTSKEGYKGDVVCPDTDLKDYYAKKHRVYWNMIHHQREYRKIMEGL